MSPRMGTFLLWLLVGLNVAAWGYFLYVIVSQV